jgi:hypothetical protein
MDRKYIYQETIYPEGMSPTTSASPALSSGSTVATASDGGAKSTDNTNKSGNP